MTLLSLLLTGLMLSHPRPDDPVPPGDTKLWSKETRALTSDQMTQLWDSVKAAYGEGSSEYLALTQALASGKVMIVNVTGFTNPLPGAVLGPGMTDATTIGINWSFVLRGLPAGIIVIHELEHWARARAAVEGNPGGAFGQDPCTKGGEYLPSGSHSSSPCELFAHTKMAINDMIEIRTKICHEVCVEDKSFICDNWEAFEAYFCGAVRQADAGYRLFTENPPNFNAACSEWITSGGSCGEQIASAAGTCEDSDPSTPDTCDDCTLLPDKPPCCDPDWEGNDPCDSDDD